MHIQLLLPVPVPLLDNRVPGLVIRTVMASHLVSLPLSPSWSDGTLPWEVCVLCPALEALQPQLSAPSDEPVFPGNRTQMWYSSLLFPHSGVHPIPASPGKTPAAVSSLSSFPQTSCSPRQGPVKSCPHGDPHLNHSGPHSLFPKH